MPLVLLFLAGYVRFLVHLPRRVRRLFLAAGGTYVGGALGMELIGGNYASWATQLPYSSERYMTYAMITTVEELLEMVGIVVFLHALMLYMCVCMSDVRVHIES
jgi:F0F1-type ATP synthase membrane subunit c/vacuolar-type H+-ATPase subunit K